MQRSAAAVSVGTARSRAFAALSRPHNWVQLAKFCLVGASGYVVNLAVYTALLRGAGIHYLPAAALLVPRRGHEQLRVEPDLDVPPRARPHRVPGPALPGRLVLALGANLLILDALVGLGVGKIVAQAVAIILVTPLNFVGNKLWSFKKRSTRRG